MNDTTEYNHPRIVARSLPEANQDVIELGAGHGVVSIGEPGTDPAYGFEESNPFHIRLEFHDVVDPQMSQLAGIEVRPPKPEDVEHLVEKANLLRTAQMVYCHCNAGVSRSTAAAYILRCKWLGQGSEYEAFTAVLEDRPRAIPNPLMVRYADDILDRDGAMIDALEQKQ